MKATRPVFSARTRADLAARSWFGMDKGAKVVAGLTSTRNTKLCAATTSCADVEQCFERAISTCVYLAHRTSAQELAVRYIPTNELVTPSAEPAIVYGARETASYFRKGCGGNEDNVNTWFALLPRRLPLLPRRQYKTIEYNIK
jgi:hypothetical protein